MLDNISACRNIFVCTTVSYITISYSLFIFIKHSPPNIFCTMIMNAILRLTTIVFDIIICQTLLQTEVNTGFPVFRTMILFSTKRCMYFIFFKVTVFNKRIIIPLCLSRLLICFLCLFQLCISCLCIFDNKLSTNINCCRQLVDIILTILPLPIIPRTSVPG